MKRLAIFRVITPFVVSTILIIPFGYASVIKHNIERIHFQSIQAEIIYEKINNLLASVITTTNESFTTKKKAEIIIEPKETQKPIWQKATIKNNNNNKNTKKLIPYNEEIYYLAYEIFIANSEPKKAYHIAYSAVQQRPKDFIWRKRLIDVAEWSGNADVGVKQLLYLWNQTNDFKYLNSAITLAKKTNIDPLLIKALKIKLSKDQTDTTTRLELTRALEREGFSDKAEKELAKHIKGPNAKRHLQELSRLYMDMGNEMAELKTLKLYDQKYGPSAQSSLRMATIYYSRGDLKKALEAMLPAEQYVKPTQTIYWQTLGSLAWLLQDQKTAYHAYHILYTTDKANPDTLQNMITILMNTKVQHNKEKAYQIAKQGWHKTGNTRLFAQMLEAGQATNQWKALANELSLLNKNQLEKVEQFPYFWEMRPTIYQKINDNEKALTYFQAAIKKFPDNENIEKAYLWFLIDTKNKDEIQALFAAESRKVKHYKDYSTVYAYAALVIDNPKLAANIFKAHLYQHLDNFGYLATYSETLEKIGSIAYANRIRYYLFAKIQRLIQKKHIKNIPSENLDVIINLYSYFNMHNLSYALLDQLVAQKNTTHDKKLFIETAIEHKDYALAEYIRTHYYPANNIPKPSIAMALADNNRPLLQKYLTQSLKKDTIPTNSDIVLASRLGRLKLAKNLAFRRFEANPSDYDSYEDLRVILLKTAPTFSTNLYYYSFQGIGGPVADLRSRILVNDHLYLFPSVSSWGVYNTDPSIIVNVPKYDTHVKLGIKYLLSRGYILTDLGFRQALRGFMTADFNYYRPISYKANLLFHVGINQTSYESVPLRIAGMKNELMLQLRYQVDPINEIVGRVRGESFFAQDYTYLGYGYGGYIEWLHSLFTSIPEFSFGPFIYGNIYVGDGSLSQPIVNLIPPDSRDDPSINFIVPASLAQYGITLFYNNSQRNRITHHWRPYFVVSVFGNYSNGQPSFGYYFDGGIAGSIFGCDNLRLYAEYSRGETQSNLVSYTVGVRYLYYF